MITLQRHQDRRAAGQSHHAPLVALDHDMIVGAERLAQTEHQAGHVIVDRVAYRKADRDTDDAGAAQHRTQQRGGPQQLRARRRCRG